MVRKAVKVEEENGITFTTYEEVPLTEEEIKQQEAEYASKLERGYGWCSAQIPDRLTPGDSITMTVQEDRIMVLGVAPKITPFSGLKDFVNTGLEFGYRSDDGKIYFKDEDPMSTDKPSFGGDKITIKYDDNFGKNDIAFVKGTSEKVVSIPIDPSEELYVTIFQLLSPELQKPKEETSEAAPLGKDENSASSLDRDYMRLAQDFLEFTPEEIFIFRQAFQSFDKEGRGAINSSQLRDTLGSMGQGLSEEDAKALLLKFDADDSGLIEWREFMEIMRDQYFFKGLELRKLFWEPSKKYLQFTQGDIKALMTAFKEYDADGSGTIDALELVNVLRAMGQGCDAAQAQDMIKKFYEGSQSDSPALTWEQFLQVMVDFYPHRSEEYEQKILTPALKTFPEFSKEDVEVFIRVFRDFDEEGDGMLNQKELGNILQAMGQGVESSQLTSLIEQFDPLGLGIINWEEFLKLLRHLYFPNEPIAPPPPFGTSSSQPTNSVPQPSQAQASSGQTPPQTQQQTSSTPTTSQTTAPPQGQTPTQATPAVSQASPAVSQASQGEEGPAYEGNLTKQGGRFKSWKKRQCKLQGGNLFYAAQGSPKGVVLAKGMIARPGKSPNSFELVNPHRTYIFKAESTQELEGWKNALIQQGAQWDQAK